MSGLRKGSLFITSLEMDIPIRDVRLQAGAVVVVAIMDGPAKIPAGTFPATIYGEDGLQVAVMACTLETDLDAARGEGVAVMARLLVTECVPAQP